MGMRLFGGSSAGRASSSSLRIGSRSAGRGGGPAPGDPRPERFEIQSLTQHGPYTVAVIRWPDAMNYDGVKVALYRATPTELRAAKLLDPHFQEGRGPLVPIARFEPTGEGVTIANSLARAMWRGEA